MWEVDFFGEFYLLIEEIAMEIQFLKARAQRQGERIKKVTFLIIGTIDWPSYSDYSGNSPVANWDSTYTLFEPFETP